MILGRKLRLFKDAKEIIFRYIEASFPITDTAVAIYDTYKLNIMLSDGLAAILNERNEIYNSFSGDLFFFNPDEIHHGRILRQGVHKYIEILIPTEFMKFTIPMTAVLTADGRSAAMISRDISGIPARIRPGPLPATSVRF